MTSYNYASFISESIESVLQQTYQNWELIIIDDASSDNSVEIIREYAKKDTKRIIFIQNEKNLGIKKSTEKAFEYVNGKYLAFLESDDKWAKDCLEKKINKIQKFPDVSLIYSDVSLFGDELPQNEKYFDYLNYCRYAGKNISNKPKNMYRIAIYRNPVISFSNIFIKSELIGNLFFNEEYQIWSDWQLVIQATIKGDFLYIDEKLLYWRVHNNSANNKFQKRINQNSEAGRFKVVLLDLIKKSIPREDSNSNIQYLYDIFSLKFKMKQIFHEIGFSMHSPGSVFREIKRRWFN
jgi:glycosyltransferase involved in cell wall biosynthesis